MQEVINLSRKVLIDCPFIQIGDNFITYGYREQGLPPDILSIVIQIESFISDGSRNGSGGGGGGAGGSYGVCGNPAEILTDTFDQDGNPIRTSSPAMKENDLFFVQYNCISGDLRDAAELAAQVNHALINSALDGVFFTISDKGVEYDVDGYNCFVSASVRLDKSVLYANDYTDETSLPIPYTMEWDLNYPPFYPRVNVYNLVAIRDINGNALNPEDYYYDVEDVYYLWTDGSYRKAESNFAITVWDLDEYTQFTDPGNLVINTTENSQNIPHEELPPPYRYVFSVKAIRKQDSIAFPAFDTQVTADWYLWDKPIISDLFTYLSYSDPDTGVLIEGYMNGNVNVSCRIGLASETLSTLSTGYFQDIQTDNPYQFVSINTQTMDVRYLTDTGNYALYGTVDYTQNTPPSMGGDANDLIYAYGTLSNLQEAPGWGTQGITLSQPHKMRYDFEATWYDSEGNVIVTNYYQKFIPTYT